MSESLTNKLPVLVSKLVLSIPVICSNVDGNKLNHGSQLDCGTKSKRKITFTGSFCSAEIKLLRIGTKLTKEC